MASEEDILELKKAFQELADFTRPMCGGQIECKGWSNIRKYHCCDEFHCGMTIDFAKKAFGIDLKPTGNEEVPLMGDAGCTAEPYLRPWCTMHLCSISSLGFTRDPEKNDEYFRLRKKCEDLMNKAIDHEDYE
jgi:hypothetical protein